jgi:hypothetical protein
MTGQMEVDRVLRSWLSDGAEHAPERQILVALERIDTTAQRRPLALPRLGHAPGEVRSPLPLAIGLMAVVVLAALGIGLGMRTGLIRLPGPQPAPTTVPHDWDDRTVRPISNPEDGYKLLLPSQWEEVSAPRVNGEPAAGIRRFRAPSGSNRALTISIGEPNGTVRICDPSCREVERQLSLDILQETLISSPEATDWREVHGDTVIGGEAARFERPNTGGIIWDAAHPTFQHFFALHDGRPVVLSFDYWPIRRGAIEAVTMRDIVDSFRFLELDTDFSDPDSLVQVSSPGDGYQLTIPADWIEAPVPSLDSEPAPGVRRFESGTDHPYGALTISVGKPDGTFVVCNPTCREANDVTSLVDLRKAIRDLETVVHDTPRGPIEAHPTSSVVRGAITWGGEAAEFQRPQAVGDRQGAAYHIYALHDGRPVLISFGLTSYARVAEIIESFRFSD